MDAGDTLNIPNLLDNLDANSLAFFPLAMLRCLAQPVHDLVRDLGGADRQARSAAYRELVDEDVLAVAGPMTTDNSLALLPTIEELQVPTISICGTSEFAGSVASSLPNGGLAEESVIIFG